MDKLLKLKAIQKYYGNRGTVTKAIDDISFEDIKGLVEVVDEIVNELIEKYKK